MKTTTRGKKLSCPKCGFTAEDQYSYKIHVTKVCTGKKK